VGPGRRVSYHFVPRARAHPRRVYLLTSRETSRGSGCESADLARSVSHLGSSRPRFSARSRVNLLERIDESIRRHVRTRVVTFKKIISVACNSACPRDSVLDCQAERASSSLSTNSGFFAFVRNKRARARFGIP